MVQGLVVKCKGLPFSCTEEDLRAFLGGSGIVEVDLEKRPDGRAAGGATVTYDNARDFNEALKRDHEHLGHRYVEVFSAEEDRGRGRSMPRRFRDDGPPRGSRIGHTERSEIIYGDGVVRVRGLPFRVTQRDINNFFSPLPILPGGILIPDERYLKKNNGEGFVVFEDPQCILEAVTRHMRNIEHRYVEVFEASYTDMVRFCEDFGIRVPEMGGGGHRQPPRRDMYDAPRDYRPRSPVFDRRPPPQQFDGYHATAPEYPWASRPATPPRDSYSRPVDSYGRAPAMDYNARFHQVFASTPDPKEALYRQPSGATADVSEDLRRPQRAYPPDDDYGRPVRPDPYTRSPATDPYARDSWRDQIASDASRPVYSVGPVDSWGTYGYGTDYRQQTSGGPVRREGGAWREQNRGGSRGGLAVSDRPGQKFVLKMRGVPFRASEAEIVDFFTPVRPTNVEIIREPGGRPSGEARVEFDSRKDYDEALLKDKQYMGSRYVELFPDFGGRY